MPRGVTKSGSPMPSEITLSIVAAMSKKRRMPDGGTLRTRSEIKSRTTGCFIATLSSRSYEADSRRISNVDHAIAPFDPCMASDEALFQQRIFAGSAFVNYCIAQQGAFDMAPGGNGHVGADHRIDQFGARVDVHWRNDN